MIVYILYVHEISSVLLLIFCGYFMLQLVKFLINFLRIDRESECENKCAYQIQQKQLTLHLFISRDILALLNEIKKM